MTLLHKASAPPGPRRYAGAMHWFWRAAICVAPAAVLGSWMNISTMERGFWWRVVDRPGDISFVLGLLALFGVSSLPILVAAGIFAALSCRPATPAHETRCRKCGYILRGISEPRCPECGERI